MARSWVVSMNPSLLYEKAVGAMQPVENTRKRQTAQQLVPSGIPSSAEKTILCNVKMYSLPQNVDGCLRSINATTSFPAGLSLADVVFPGSVVVVSCGLVIALWTITVVVRWWRNIISTALFLLCIYRMPPLFLTQKASRLIIFFALDVRVYQQLDAGSETMFIDILLRLSKS